MRMAKDIAAQVPPYFGTRLDTSMAALRLKRCELARRLDITPGWVSGMAVMGKVPSVPLLARMRQVLGAHAIDYCMGVRNDPPKFRVRKPRPPKAKGVLPDEEHALSDANRSAGPDEGPGHGASDAPDCQ